MSCVFFFQAEDGIRDLVRSRGLGDVYKRQAQPECMMSNGSRDFTTVRMRMGQVLHGGGIVPILSLIHI